MRPLPRINGPIFDTGENFTADNFSLGWNAAMEELETSAGSGVGGAIDPAIAGYGRIAGADYFSTDSSAPRLPSSPALALEFPNAAWLVQGLRIVLNEPSGALLISGVPANMAGKYGYVSAFEIEASGGVTSLEILPANWFTQLQPQLSAGGLVCIGKVTSDADSVTAIDATDADVIVPLDVLRRVLRALLAMGSGEGGGAVFGSTIPITPEDATVIKTYIEESDAAQRAELLELIGAIVPGQRAVKTPLDHLVHELQIARSELAVTQETLRRVMALLLTAPQIETLAQDGLTVRPRVVERSQSATIGPNFGSGEQSTPSFEGEGAGKNADGTFGVVL